jgi:hypothetical protein
MITKLLMEMMSTLQQQPCNQNPQPMFLTEAPARKAVRFEERLNLVRKASST